MLILFDNGTPRGIARELPGHTVKEAREQGWDDFEFPIPNPLEHAQVLTNSFHFGLADLGLPGEVWPGRHRGANVFQHLRSRADAETIGHSQ